MYWQTWHTQHSQDQIQRTWHTQDSQDRILANLAHTAQSRPDPANLAHTRQSGPDPANLAHTRQSGPGPGPGLRAKYHHPSKVVPFSLGSGPAWRRVWVSRNLDHSPRTPTHHTACTPNPGGLECKVYGVQGFHLGRSACRHEWPTLAKSPVFKTSGVPRSCEPPTPLGPP